MGKTDSEKVKELKELENKISFNIFHVKRFNELANQLKPLQCPYCFEYIIEGDYTIVEYNKEMVRAHQNCIITARKQAKESQKIMNEITEKYNLIRKEVKENKRKTIGHIYLTVTGFKKDIERLQEDLDKIAQKYNLEPWKRVKNR